MSTKLSELKDSFLSKQSRLEMARKTLKTEFFGIDKAIDELINNTRSWYILNTYQNRPLVVNLWGLTGVGKTSLVARLAELIGYKDRLFKFDLGDKNGLRMSNDLEDICERNADEDIIIVLDEFQHTRTLKGAMRTEIANDTNRKIWELLDSGKIEYLNFYRGYKELAELVKKLEYFISKGIQVEKGLVTKGWEHFNSEFDTFHFIPKSSNKKIDKSFIDGTHYDDIMRYAGSHYNFTLTSQLKNHLYTLNAEQSLDFMLNVIRLARRPQVKNFSKSLIFVIGNLDEAYQMSHNLSADIDADTFCEASLKITVPQIKQALTTRFRNEQIARLGNIHIIYPALSKKAYRSVIHHELESIKQQTRNLLEMELEFDESVIILIYKEGVFPTQGVRPLLTTINYLIKTNLPICFSEILLHNLTTTHLKFVVENKRLVCHYMSDMEIVHKKRMAVETPLETIRISKKDDLQAIVAVHESGHAVISSILLKVIPDQVYSVSTDTDSHGFVYSKFPVKFIAKKEIVKRVAMFLGGYVAEELVFGKDHVTAGSSSDIQSATAFLSCMYKSEGLGDYPVFYDMDSSNNNAIHHIEDVELQIQETIKNAYNLAKETLEKEMQLLLVISDYLSDHSSIKKEDLQQMIQAHTVSDIEFMESNDSVFYRSHLRKTISENKKNTSGVFEGICLNHGEMGG